MDRRGRGRRGEHFLQEGAGAGREGPGQAHLQDLREQRLHPGGGRGDQGAEQRKNRGRQGAQPGAGLGQLTVQVRPLASCWRRGRRGQRYHEQRGAPYGGVQARTLRQVRLPGALRRAHQRQHHARVAVPLQQHLQAPRGRGQRELQVPGPVRDHQQLHHRQHCLHLHRQGGPAAPSAAATAHGDLPYRQELRHQDHHSHQHVLPQPPPPQTTNSHLQPSYKVVPIQP